MSKDEFLDGDAESEWRKAAGTVEGEALARPWRVGLDTDNYTLVFDVNNKLAAKVKGHQRAELICKAVNSFDESVAALDSIVQLVDWIMEDTPKLKLYHADNKRIADARAVLAKIKEQQ